MAFDYPHISVRLYRYGKEPRVLTPINYNYWRGDEIIKFTIHKGFRTDFATIPRVFWWLIQPIGGKHALPSVLHDWLYVYGYKRGISRKEADAIFKTALLECGVSKVTAWIMWASVRAFAASRYERADGVDSGAEGENEGAK